MKKSASGSGSKNSSFAELPAPTSSADQAEAWVRGEMIDKLMTTARNSRMLSAAVTVTLVVFGWGQVPTWQLLGWVVLSLAVSAWRTGAERFYDLHRAQRDGAWQQRFIAGYIRLWMASAVVWGLSILIFFERPPDLNQFLCGLFVSGVAVYALNDLALYMPLLKRYFNTLFITIFVALGWRIVENKFDVSEFLYAFLGVSAVHWYLLMRTGARVYQSHRNTYELLYHNNSLIHSLTEQRAAAMSAVALKNRFLASAAHDIRQPVLALSLYADWLRNEPELVREIAPKIVRATQAVNTLFDSLFDLARLDSGQVRVHVEPIDIEQLLHDLDVQYRPTAEAKGLEFRVRALEGQVQSDPIRVRRMIGNLLSNAIRYTDRGGVLLAVRRRRDGFFIEVWDTGIGIPAEHLDDIFLEFYKVKEHDGTSDGFGLGLPIVLRLANVLDHPVTLCSRPGLGSMFRVHVRDVSTEQAQARAELTAQ